MGKIQNIFKNIDSFIFKKLDLLINQSGWQRISDRFRLLSEPQQKYSNHLLSLLLVVLPISVVALLGIFNLSMNSALNVKKDIARSINVINEKKSEFSTLERKRLSRTQVSDRKSANSMLSKSLERKGVDTSKIKLTDYAVSGSGTNVNISSISFTFKDFSNNELSNTFSALIDREKVTIPILKIRKNKKENALNGTMKIIHYSKGSK
ncbi:MAG: hypothetical protein KAG61_10595 [Bacteriovoracaceae bacterium]|nr:hypothetical protein [Bacteriovoracaceae bacterium]